MTVCVYTAVAGGYLPLQPHVEIADVDFIAFTDDLNSGGDAAGQWDVRPLAVTPCVDLTTPRHKAKRYKIFPHHLLADYDQTIWLDAAFEVTDQSFVKEALSLMHDGIALWPHPNRDDIYDEAAVSVNIEKYAGQPLMEQVAHYCSTGFPEHAGLWACGAIARDNRDRRIWSLNELWWREIERWTDQDQLSFPWVCDHLGIVPGKFPASPFDNPWMVHKMWLAW